MFLFQLIWLCNLCKKKQDLLAKSGKWMRSPHSSQATLSTTTTTATTDTTTSGSTTSAVTSTLDTNTTTTTTANGSVPNPIAPGGVGVPNPNTNHQFPNHPNQAGFHNGNNQFPVGGAPVASASGENNNSGYSLGPSSAAGFGSGQNYPQQQQPPPFDQVFPSLI